MATEEITINGQKVKTLMELLRPGLNAVFVGINPALESVRRGHYYQGSHGRHFWKQLKKYQIIPVPLPEGAEDDTAFRCGFGFADLVRRPTDSASKLTAEELSAGVGDLAVRLSKTGDHPTIVFRYKQAWSLAQGQLRGMGHLRMFYMPSPYTKVEDANSLMKELQADLLSRHSESNV